MDKEDVVCAHSGISVSRKKEWHASICTNMGGAGGEVNSKSDAPRVISQSLRDELHVPPA